MATPDATTEVAASVRQHSLRELLDEAYRDHSAAVYAFAHDRRGPGSATEITSEVFVRLLLAADRFDPARGSLRGFLLMLAEEVVRHEPRGHTSSSHQGLSEALQNKAAMAQAEGMVMERVATQGPAAMGLREAEGPQPKQ